ncbi:MAG TPA: protein translocase subunit SecD [Pyrinomonadaceae bacterium]|jgi:preprotein translocase subunit SecD
MKKRNILVRFIIIAAVTLLAIYAVFGPRRAPAAEDFTWNGIKNNLAQNIHLGLDLKGGTHLVMRVQSEQYLSKLAENNAEAARNAATKANLPVSDARAVAEPKNRNFQVVLTTPDSSKQQEIADAVKKEVDFSLWTQSSAADSIVWSLPIQAQAQLSRQAVEQAKAIIESRINRLGVTEPTLQNHGSSDSHQLLLQMPGVQDPERIKKTLTVESRLELMKVVTPKGQFQTFPTEEAAKASLGGNVPSNRRVLPYVEREDTPANQNEPKAKPTLFVVVENPPIIDGSELRDATPFTTGGNSYNINFNLKPSGAQKFGAWTGANIGEYLAIVLNGEVKSAPVIRGQIYDTGQIEGRFTQQSAEDLAVTLKSGALPAQIEYQEERTVGPSLGADSIRSGVTASVAGLLFVMAFMLFYYRGSGVNAVIALILNMLLTLAALVWFGATLTLPGIAGLILGIGMAVDSNVLIFERIREELRAGKLIPQAVDLGFDRAFITIIDTHVTTIISSLLLFIFGTGPIRGFAITLILGLLINLFSAVYVSRTIFIWLLSRKQRVETLSI